MWQNIKTIFGKKNIFWHILAILLTYVIVISGIDYIYYQVTIDIAPRTLIFPALMLGGLLPILIPLILYFTGYIRKNLNTLKIAFALGQAAILGSLISSMYKAFTGRAHPSLGTEILTDITRDFSFGFLREGVFWGWPSSHTTVAFAMSFALITLFPKKKSVIIPAFLYALYVGLSVSISIHWFSDFIAGAIFGTVIGIAVGRSFYTSH